MCDNSVVEDIIKDDTLTYHCVSSSKHIGKHERQWTDNNIAQSEMKLHQST